MPDAASDLLSFTAHLRKAAEPADGAAFRSRIDSLFRNFEAKAQETGAGRGEIELAKYALAATIDETVLSSNWSIKNSWAGNPLQMEYFDSFAAGEEFYVKLDSLRNTSDPGRRQVLEVYYLCLALGFKGKYGDLQGMERLRSLMESLSRELRSAEEGGRGSLSPGWERTDDVQQIVRGFPVWVLTVACGGVLLLLYIVLRTILGIK